MLQHADHVGLVEEHLAGDLRALRIFGGLDVVDLDGDVTPEIGIMRQEHRAGATGPISLMMSYLPILSGQDLARVRVVAGSAIVSDSCSLAAKRR